MVRWLGMNAVYDEPERAILAALPAREQAFLHTLKAFTEGTLEEAPLVPRSSSGSVTDSSVATEIGFTPGETWRVAPEDREGGAPVYINAEDIEFGPPKKKRPVYALCWTWRHHRIVKTKQRATRSMRAWKKWYERQGWKVTSHDTGYFARHPSGQAHSISLHEYDRESKERLR